MRLMFVISTLERSGPVNVLYDMCKEFILLGHVVKVITLAAEGGRTRINDFEELGVIVKCVASSRIKSLVIGKLSLKKEIARFDPDVINLHGFRSYILGSGIPYTVATLHNTIWDDFSQTYSFLQAKLMTYFEVKALKRLSRVVACSESCAREVNAKYQLNADFIRNGVDQSVYYPLTREQKQKRKEEMFGSAKAVMIFTGGCSARKRTKNLINVFQIQKLYKKYDLHILGKGDQFEECQKLAVKDVYLDGYVNNVVRHLQVADIYISLSSTEGFPMSVLEALSCGLGVILSDIPSHREIYSLFPDRVKIIGESSSLIEILQNFHIPNDNDLKCLNAISSKTMCRNYLKIFHDLYL